MSRRTPDKPVSRQGRRHRAAPSARRRMVLVIGLLGLASIGLVARAFDLQVVREHFYQSQGDARFLREMPIPVSRGSIFDRNGAPLAVSTPVMSIWANPSQVLDSGDRIPALAKLLGVDASELQQRLAQRSQREFVYLRRQMSPEAAKAVLDLGIPGINGQREFKRFYPSGGVTAHVLGFTNIDDHGQEGLELAYDDWLSGKPGAKQVIRDGKGHVVEDVQQIRAPKPGRDLTLSIDRRLQFLAYSELKDMIEKAQANSGSMVILDVKTGEVLAMVNLPTYNPNDVQDSTPGQRRNRAVTDVIEPGSTMKPILMSAALSSGKFTPTSPILYTSPGTWQFAGHLVRDDHNFGALTPTGVLTKSSNIGAAKIADQLNTSLMYDTYRAMGLGNSTNSGFPGEASGHLKIGADWRPFEKATMAFGYGVSATPLQMANAYATIADHGVMHDPTFIKGDDNPGKQVLSPEVADDLVRMLETITAPGGTAVSADIANYSVAGKTGTAYRTIAGGYAKHNYNAFFAGIVPASNPRLVAYVAIENPTKGSHFGTAVSAPVFAKVMTGAMRLLDIPPDNIGRWYVGGPLQAAGNLAGHQPALDVPEGDVMP